MQLFVKFIKTYALEIEETATVDYLKSIVEEKTNVSKGDQRLLYAGIQLEDDYTLEYYKIKKESTLHLVIRMRGMIGVWTDSDISDPLDNYLMLTEEDRVITKILSANILNNAIVRFGASLDTEYSITQSMILSSLQSQRCVKFLDYIYNTITSIMPDLKVCFDDINTLKLLLLNNFYDNESYNSNVVKELLDLHPHYENDDSKVMIILRRTQGPIPGCIKFHLDDQYEFNYTVQLTLVNSNTYDGGRLCFVSRDGLVVPERPMNCITIHNSKVLHGVTRLTKGVRYSLFIVDKKTKVGDDQIVTVTQQDVLNFTSIIYK